LDAAWSSVMSQKSGRQFTAEQKLALVRRHVLEKVPISDLCNETGIQPSVFYSWQKQLFEQGAAAFDRTSKAPRVPAREKQLEARISSMEAKLAHKDAVIAEISEEFVKAKKSNGEP
jgi:transposase